MAAFAPIPSASVTATVNHRARTRLSERTAILRSCRNDIVKTSEGKSDSLKSYYLDKYVDINYSWAVSRTNALPYETTQMVRDCCLCLHVQRAARALARRFDEE